MIPSVRKAKNEQLKRLLNSDPTSGRIKEVWRLARELQLGPGWRAKILTWERGRAKS